jgi:hypothetical protein
MRNRAGEEDAMPLGQDGETTGGPRAGGGHNHGRAGRAMRGLAFALALAAGTALAEGDPLVQRGVPAEATAENAVVARDRALAAGQRLAYERMAEAMGLPRNIPDREIEAMVASLVIESERVTARGYSARITVNFRPPGAPTGPRPTAALPPLPNAPAIASIEAMAEFRSLGEYAELQRRLAASLAVARAELISISPERARWRLALRVQPEQAGAEFEAAGLALGAGGDPREGWRLGLGAR